MGESFDARGAKRIPKVEKMITVSASEAEVQ
jgi:hypothetical protein